MHNCLKNANIIYSEYEAKGPLRLSEELGMTMGSIRNFAYRLGVKIDRKARALAPERYCWKCRRDLPRNEFHNNTKYFGGKAHLCKNCTKFYTLEKRYGLTEEVYSSLLQEQEGRCKICTNFMEIPNVDHCHTTGKMRGIICSSCNSGLGFFKDNEWVMTRAIEYLRSS